MIPWILLKNPEEYRDFPECIGLHRMHSGVWRSGPSNIYFR